jgi:CBS domain-containing protein
MKVNQLMSRGVVCCAAGGTLVEPAKAMWEQDIGFVPIVAAGSGELRGVVTDRDICMAAMTKGRALHEIPVEEVMRKDVWSCSDNDEIARVHAIMRDHQLRRVPVVDRDRRVVGVVSLNDLARHADAAAGKAMRDAFIKTVGAVCRPHLLTTKKGRPQQSGISVAASG